MISSPTIRTNIPSSNPAFGVTFLDSKPVQQEIKGEYVYHLVFWLTIYLYHAVYLGFLYDGSYKYFLFEYSIIIPFLIGLCYFHAYWLLPKFVTPRKYFFYSFFLVGTVILVSIAILTALNLLVYANICPRFYYPDGMFDAKFLIKRSFEGFSLVGLTAGLKLFKDWTLQQRHVKELESQNLRTELNFLKTQMQPHFFFNTLNNLYSLTIKKSDNAPDVVVKLSELMSYMLYESEKATIPLSKEVEFVNYYLDLERLRFGSRVKLHIEIIGSTEGKLIPPLLLIPFIENAIKHGTLNSRPEVNIYILIRALSNELVVETQNPKPEFAHSGRNKGLGLRNTKRRLELLFKEQFELSLKERDEEVIARLKIPMP